MQTSSHVEPMATAASLRSIPATLDLDLPSMPQVMVELSIAMAQDEPDMRQISNIISRDMALSASIMRTLNSPIYALRKPVSSIDQAITYLGYREVASQTFQHALRSVFAPSKQLDNIMGRATLRSLVMGRLAQLLDFENPWLGHAAGIFEECGKAILLRAHGDTYGKMLDEAGVDELALREIEIASFGIGSDALSAMLCERWGVAEASCEAIRARLDVKASMVLPKAQSTKEIAFLSLLANAMLTTPSTAVDLAKALCVHVGKNEGLVVSMTEKLVNQIATPSAAM